MKERLPRSDRREEFAMCRKSICRPGNRRKKHQSNGMTTVSIELPELKITELMFNKIASGLALIALVGTISTASAENHFSEWWKGPYATGNWLGARDALVDRGVTLSGEWKANFLWNADGGLQQRFGYDDEWKFRVFPSRSSANKDSRSSRS